MRVWLILLTSMALCGQAAAQDADRAQVRGAVERGLAMLSTLQEKDGSWQLLGHKSPAVTSLAVMAFLSAGHVPGEGPYQAQLEHAIHWVLRCQRDGRFVGQDNTEMYPHAICTLMLAEVAGMTDAELGRQIKPALEKAVAVLLRAQRTGAGTTAEGGWRYPFDGNEADLSVSGWPILALRAARNLGCDIPAERLDLALDYVRRCYNPQLGGFAYMPGNQVTKPCTGTGILAVELYGSAAKRQFGAEVLKAKAYLVNNPLVATDEHFFYAAYYGAQAMYQPGSNYWHIYRGRLHRLLFEQQQRNGSWICQNGPSYATAMAILALTVEYRLLPIYQRHEGPP